MEFLKKIFIKIVHLSSSLFRNDKITSSNPTEKEKTDKKKIEEKKIQERETIIKKIDKTTNRVTTLSEGQKKIINDEHRITNKKPQKLSVFNIEKLAYEKELLETNLKFQKTKVFIPHPIASEAIINLKKELDKNKLPKTNALNILQENRKIIKNLRDEDKNFIVKKRENIFKFSLIELFKESERIKEIERIEAQKKEEKRIRNLKFDKAIKKAQKLIKDYDFDAAETELKKALSINNLRHKVVSNLKNEIIALRNHFEKQKAEFKLVFERANVQMMNKDYQNALKNFNHSKLYDINIEDVNNKIRLVKAHIQHQKINEENFLKERVIFIDEVQNKRFIKANRTLARIIENIEGKEIEIENLQKLFDESKFNHKKVKNKYKQSIEKAEAFYVNGDLISANRIFEDCLNLNIDNDFCKKRIREIKHKQDLDLKKKKILEKKAKQEVQRLVELNKYKKEKEEILSFLRSQDITKFYHFTDESNLASIRANNGLYSWFYCEGNGIEINKPGGDSTSKELDWKYDLHNFVRLSFTNNHPMKYIAEQDGRIRNSKNLEIDIETATLKNTLFSDVNATKKGHHVGGDLNFLKNNIKFNVVNQRNHFNLSKEDKPFYQAEIMVEEHIESKYITNL